MSVDDEWRYVKVWWEKDQDPPAHFGIFTLDGISYKLFYLSGKKFFALIVEGKRLKFLNGTLWVEVANRIRGELLKQKSL